jgi:hypothetical protein
VGSVVVCRGLWLYRVRRSQSLVPELIVATKLAGLRRGRQCPDSAFLRARHE